MTVPPDPRDGDWACPPLTLTPDRKAEEDGTLTCYRCGKRGVCYQPIGGAWAAACAEHAPEDDST